MRRTAGFTLLEVLLAIFVLALVGTQIVNAVGHNLSGLGRARVRARTVELATERVHELVADGGFPDLGTSEGEFEEPWEDLYWELEVEPYWIPLPPSQADGRRSSSIFMESSVRANVVQPSLRRVTVRVFGPGDDPEHGVTVIAFAVNPSFGPAAGAGGGARLGMVLGDDGRTASRR